MRAPCVQVRREGFSVAGRGAVVSERRWRRRGINYLIALCVVTKHAAVHRSRARRAAQGATSGFPRYPRDKWAEIRVLL